ncbi:MAG: Gldg family protein [Promethearchaeota archaeon]
MQLINKPKVVLDQAHNNSLVIETTSYEEFIQFLFQNFAVGKISQLEITEEKLAPYKLLIIGNPRAQYTIEEINVILEFVKKGGRLLIFSDEGGDISNKTNLNGITRHLGFEILPNLVFDNSENAGKVIWPVFGRFYSHPITAKLSKIAVAAGCSFEVLSQEEYQEFEEFADVSLQPLIRGSLTSRMKIFDYSTNKWDEQSAKDTIIAISGIYAEGKFAALPTPSILSSINKNYGWNAVDNALFIAELINWLMKDKEKIIEASQYSNNLKIEIKLDKQNYKFITSLLKDKSSQWNEISEIINYAIKLFKDQIYSDNAEQEKTDKEP